MPVGKGRNDIDDLFGDLLGDDLGDSRSPSPPVARKGKKVDVYDDAFYEQLAKDSGAQNPEDDDQPPNPQELKQTMDSINFDDLESDLGLFGGKKAEKSPSPVVSRKSRVADPLVGRSSAVKTRVNETKTREPKDDAALDDDFFSLDRNPQQKPSQPSPASRKTPNEKGDGVGSRQNLSKKKPAVEDDDDLGDLDDLLNSDDDEKTKKPGKKQLSFDGGLPAEKDKGGGVGGGSPETTIEKEERPPRSPVADGAPKKRPPINFDDDDDDPDGMDFLNGLLKTDGKEKSTTEGTKAPSPIAPNSRPPPSPQQPSRPSSPEKDLFDTSGDADILGDLLPGDDDDRNMGKNKNLDKTSSQQAKQKPSEELSDDKLFGGDFMSSLMGEGAKKDSAPTAKQGVKTFDFNLDDKYKTIGDGAESGSAKAPGNDAASGRRAEASLVRETNKKSNDEDFSLFGGYMPSSADKPSPAAATGSPKRAPLLQTGKKSVSLSKDDDDFSFGGYAPTASGQREGAVGSKKAGADMEDDWLADLKNSRGGGGAGGRKSPTDATARKATADWLGLDESELVSPSRPKTPLSSRTSSPIKMDPDFERAMYGSGGGGRSSPTRRQTMDSPLFGQSQQQAPTSRPPRSRQSSTRSAAAEAFLGLGGEVEIVDDVLPPPKVLRKKQSSQEVATPSGVAVADSTSMSIDNDAETLKLKRMIESQQLQMQKNQAALEAELKKKQMANMLKQQEMQLQQQQQMQQQQLAAIAAASTVSVLPGLSGNEAEKIKELEKKVFKLELEKENLEARLELVLSRHQMEMEEMTEFHRRKEARKEEEREDRCAELKRKVTDLEEMRNRATQERADALLEGEKRRVDEIRLLNDTHQKATEEMQRHHEEVVSNLKKSKMAELDAALATHDNAQNLNAFVAKLSNNTSDLTSLAAKVEAEHKQALGVKEAALSEKDEQLQQLHTKLHQLSTESEKERKQLQTVLAKMEKHLSTTTEELNQERWNLSREKSRVEALQTSLEEERKGANEKAASDWIQLQKAKEAVLAEQKQLIVNVQREKASLHEERLKVATDQDSLQKGAMELQRKAEEKMTECAMQKEQMDELRNDLDLRERKVKRDEERLDDEFRRLESEVEGVEEEKDNLRQLAETLKGKSEELEEEMEKSVAAYEVGVSALNEARNIEEEQKARLFQIQNQMERNRSLQKELAEERLLLARERVGFSGGGGGGGGGEKSLSSIPRKKVSKQPSAADVAVSDAPSMTSANLSAGEIIDRVDEIEEERTIGDAIDSLLVDQSPSALKDQRNSWFDQTEVKSAFSVSRPEVSFPASPSSNIAPRPSTHFPISLNASNDRFSNILGAALGQDPLGNLNRSQRQPMSADEVLLSSFGQLDDASTTEAVLLLIDGQRENEYLKEEQKFLARLKLRNKKR